MELLDSNSPWFPYVWVDPDRLGGEPAFRNTRVHVRSLFDYLAHGHTIEEFLNDFEGVTRAQVEGVLGLAGESALRGLKAA